MQILRGLDGKIQVHGLMPGQQLIRTPDGKLHVLSTSQVQSNASTAVPKTTTSPTKTIIKPAVSTPVSKVQMVPGNNSKMVVQSPNKQTQSNNTLLIRQQVMGSPVVQKVASPNTVVVSGGQVFTGQQIVVGANQVIAPSQVSLIIMIIIQSTLLQYGIWKIILIRQSLKNDNCYVNKWPKYTISEQIICFIIGLTIINWIDVISREQVL